ncbi:MAG TPA: rhodanese-like domain-containing protein, partial [Labilithrix sp.]|nr:rhodanese-like domain-containing protein [Labilithrix sp.]
PAPAAASAPAEPAASAPAASAAERVDGKAAKALVKDGARLVDVRTPQEYAEKHVEGAANVPVDTISSADLGPKDKAVVVYCGSGARSKRAAEALRARGYTRIYDLGAMSRWDE